MWFDLLHTIHYFIIVSKSSKTGTTYAESYFLQDSNSGIKKKLGLWLRLWPWAIIQTPGTPSPTPHPWIYAKVNNIQWSGTVK